MTLHGVGIVQIKTSFERSIDEQWARVVEGDGHPRWRQRVIVRAVTRGWHMEQVDRWSDNAHVLVLVDQRVQACLLYDESRSHWRYIRIGGERPVEMVCEDMVDAMLQLHLDISLARRALPPRAFTNGPVNPVVTPLTARGEEWLRLTGELLMKAYERDRLAQDQLMLFYEHFASPEVRRTIDRRWRARPRLTKGRRTSPSPTDVTAPLDVYSTHA